jgi:hypothetical protein
LSRGDLRVISHLSRISDRIAIQWLDSAAKAWHLACCMISRGVYAWCGDVNESLCKRKAGWGMRSRILVGTLFLLGVLAVGTIATSGDGRGLMRQSAVVYLTEPTLIGSTIVEGPVLFTHDNTKMARGEPCTTVYLLASAKRPAEEVASFHCIPTPRKIAHKFTIRTRPNAVLGFGCVLAEFQFAGDSEGHGVPGGTSALASAEGSTETGGAHR